MNASRSETLLLLVGGGHAHLEALRRQILEPALKLDVTLVSAYDHHHYSGMVPGYVAGLYAEKEISFDLAALASKARAHFFRGVVVAIDNERRAVKLEDGRSLHYDLVSFNIGSRTFGAADLAVKDNIELVKPISRAALLKRRLWEIIESRPPLLNLSVVGGGAAGVELACALDRAIAIAGLRRKINLIEAGKEILPGYPPRFRVRAQKALSCRGIALRTRSQVAAVEKDRVQLADGSQIPSDLSVWVTGPAAQPIFEKAGLAVCTRGFLLVDDGLRSISDPRIFAAGDCATLVNHPETPKAGVYAVRQASLLWENIVASHEGTRGSLFLPQKDFLSILNTADRRSLLHWKGFTSHSRWAWRLKDWIDRRFVRRYQSLC